MKMVKHRTNITVDKEVWAAFCKWTGMIGYSASGKLEEFMRSCIENSVPNEYEATIRETINSQIDTIASDEMTRAIAERVAILLDKRSHFSEIIDVDSVEDTHDTSAIVSVQNTHDVQNSINTHSVPDEDKNSEVARKTELSREEVNIAKFKQYSALDNRKSYTDKRVAETEGLKQQTVNRYRRGQRSPKPDFIERWGLNWNGSQWIKNNSQ